MTVVGYEQTMGYESLGREGGLTRTILVSLERPHEGRFGHGRALGLTLWFGRWLFSTCEQHFREECQIADEPVRHWWVGRLHIGRFGSYNGPWGPGGEE